MTTTYYLEEAPLGGLVESGTREEAIILGKMGITC
jgi:hypothetical protein